MKNMYFCFISRPSVLIHLTKLDETFNNNLIFQNLIKRHAKAIVHFYIVTI